MQNTVAGQDWSNEKVYLEQTKGEAGGRLESGALQARGSEAGTLEVLIHQTISKQKPLFDTRFQQEKKTTCKCK